MTTDKPGFLKTWFLATRPFSWTPSTMPVLFGTVLALAFGGATMHWGRFLLALVGMVSLHSASNLFNDVSDHKKGLDVQVNPVSGAVVRGWLSRSQALTGAILFLLVGVTLGGSLVYLVGMPILYIGLAGVASILLYDAGPVSLKFHALGDLAVFINFGVLGALGAWTVQTGSVSWLPGVWAIPMSILVIGILHANNWRDIPSDTKGGVRTVANLLGDHRSLSYYGFLLFAPFAFVVSYVAVSGLGHLEPRMPWTFLVTLLALPLAVKLFRRGASRHQPVSPTDFVALDGASAQLNLVFSLLCVAAVGLNVLVQRVLQ